MEKTIYRLLQGAAIVSLLGVFVSGYFKQDDAHAYFTLLTMLMVSGWLFLSGLTEVRGRNVTHTPEGKKKISGGAALVFGLFEITVAFALLIPIYIIIRI